MKTGKKQDQKYTNLKRLLRHMRQGVYDKNRILYKYYTDLLKNEVLGLKNK